MDGWSHQQALDYEQNPFNVTLAMGMDTTLKKWQKIQEDKPNPSSPHEQVSFKSVSRR